MNKEIYYIKSREYLTLNKIIIKSTVYINIIPIFISYPYTFVCNYIMHRALIFTDATWNSILVQELFRDEISEYIELFFTQQRTHSFLDYKYPYEYEELAS